MFIKRKKENNVEPEPVSLVVLKKRRSYVAEQYRMLRSNILFAANRSSLKTLMLTSSVSGEGKSTTAANLAIVFAESGTKTLLIDCDMRRATVNKTFKMDSYPGLSNLLTENGSNVKDYISFSGIPHLDIMPSGHVPSDPAALLASKKFDRMLEELEKIYGLVILDTPPVTLVSDAQILSSKADGVLIVVRKDVSQKRKFLSTKTILEHANANILGAVYKEDDEVKDEYYHYYSPHQ